MKAPAFGARGLPIASALRRKTDLHTILGGRYAKVKMLDRYASVRQSFDYSNILAEWHDIFSISPYAGERQFQILKAMSFPGIKRHASTPEWSREICWTAAIGTSAGLSIGHSRSQMRPDGRLPLCASQANRKLGYRRNQIRTKGSELGHHPRGHRNRRKTKNKVGTGFVEL
jgi:hypothetical protein